MKIEPKSYLNILEESFPGIKNNIIRCEKLGFPWEASKLFLKQEDSKVLSHVALLECRAIIDGAWHKLGALHGICTLSTCRGKGLATELIQEALSWAQGRCDALLLFTEIPLFYEQLGFTPIKEYRFHLARQQKKGTQALRQIRAPRDNTLFIRCFREREVLSNRFFIQDNGSIASFNTLFATYPDYWSLFYSEAFDGFISFELKDKALHLYDIISNKIPSLDVILEHIPAEINDVYFYFSPDKLTDEATAEHYLYDNGYLLIHGAWHLSKPFMVSPLSRC
jgi:GNAT superfamily N-acetyltransferase